MNSDSKLSYEVIAQRAQIFFAERPVIVLGTGVTIPHGLPSMTNLADTLLSTIRDKPDGWDIFSQRLNETKDLEQALHDVPLPDETIEVLVRATWEIVSIKDIDFYQKLLKRDIEYPIADMFRYLLRTTEAHLRVVTTNYDRVAEYAANYVNAYASTGVTAGWLQRFFSHSVNSERPPSPGFDGMVTILKVHGSLDWFRNADGDVIAIPFTNSIPDGMKPLVVTPGVTKYREVHKDPFRTVMSAADTVLRDATCYVCIGYGFNDEHVQPVLLSRVMKEDIPLLVITKELTEQARRAFLKKPPKRFLFLEEASGGTQIYTPENPEGMVMKGVYIWQLQEFMKLITGVKRRE